MRDLGSVDLVVIGGGINGVGIARDAAGRGLSVVLCEKGDLAEGTSSRSGKLIHGGLRYLEHFEFRLVREALIEREVLLRAAPHIVWPMRFVLPHAPGQRPAWLIRTGLFLYDHLGGRKMLPGCRRLDLAQDPEGKPVKPQYRLAFEYSDCWVDDARLVILNAIDAREKGALVLPHTTATSARRDNGEWLVELRTQDGTTASVRGRILVNAAGPWVEDVAVRVAGSNAGRRVRLVKGSHIVVRKFWDGPQAYLLQNHDNRVIFVNPYERDLCLIGTTDVPYDGRAEDVAIGPEEIGYLLNAVNKYMRKQIVRDDILQTFSGVRPLYDDRATNPSAVTRDYVFDISGSPPILSVFGGKITTYRKLAEHALHRLSPYLQSMGKDWTAGAALPGGDIPNGSFDDFHSELRRAYEWLPCEISLHMARCYGTRTYRLLDGARSVTDLGRHFGASLFEREIDYLKREEWAKSADDVLDRRTKYGLHLTREQRSAVAEYLS